MKMKLLYVPMGLVVLMSALVNEASSSRAVTTTGPWWTTTTGPQGLNLNGKMFTLSDVSEGISFYPPSFSSTTAPYPTRTYTTTRRPYTTTRRPHTTTRRPHTTTRRPHTTTRRPHTTTRRPHTTTRRPHTTTRRPYTTTRRPYTTTTYTTTPPYTTSAPSTRGVSVCLRYLATYQQTIFTLSPSSRNPLKLETMGSGQYRLRFDSYGNAVMLQPNIFWSNTGRDIWNRVCVTVDSMKRVAQMFSGMNMSIRVLLRNEYAWSGEPVIKFSGFNGQVTDVQVWDYPLSYREIFSYMTNGVYWRYRGSVLTWSSISYSNRGNALLEDAYGPIRGEGRGRRLKGEKRAREFSNLGERSRQRETM